MRSTRLSILLVAALTTACGRTPPPVPANSPFLRACTEGGVHKLIDKHVAGSKVTFSMQSESSDGNASSGKLNSKKEFEGTLKGTEEAVGAVMKALLADFEAIGAKTGTAIDMRRTEFGADQGRRHLIEFNYEAGELGGTVRVHAEASPDEKGAEKEFRLTMKLEEMFPGRKKQ